MKPQQKFSLNYYLFVFFTILMLESIFFSGAAVKEISYNHFRNMLAADRIQSVILESDRIFGLEKATKTSGNGATDKGAVQPSSEFEPARKQAPWHLNFNLFSNNKKQPAEQQFVVIRLSDPSLIADLQAHGVDYRGKIESHWLTTFIFSFYFNMK